MTANRNTLSDAMDAMVSEIKKARRALTNAYVILPDAAKFALNVAVKAEHLLSGEARRYVLTDGGPHGSPEAAWRAWVDLAQGTVEMLNKALAYSDRVSLTAWIQKGAGAFVDTGTALVNMGKDAAKATGAGLSLVALVLGLLVVLEFQRGRA